MKIDFLVSSILGKFLLWPTASNYFYKMANTAEDHNGLRLPLALATATNAVKNKLKLIRHKLKSKSHIRTFELKLFLLIFTMFPEDSRIPVGDFVAFGMGLKLFEDVQHLAGARDRVQYLIDIINQRKLFNIHLEEDEHDDHCIKLAVGSHDIASRELGLDLLFKSKLINQNFPATNEYQNCYGLSFVLRNVSEHPVNWNYPKLALLVLKYRENSQSVDFFGGMRNLRVLYLDVLSLPLSFHMLRNLRTLRLKVVKLIDLSPIASLVNLEFLIVSSLCFVDIPKEMGQLCNLRLLNLRKMNLAYVAPGVLSNLLKLEELYFPLSFRKWGGKAGKKAGDYDEYETTEGDSFNGEEKMNASFREISSLSLRELHICVPNASMWCKDSPLVKSIERFKILVLDELTCQQFSKSSTKELQLTGDLFDIKESAIFDLISKTEDLSLIKVRNLKSIMHGLAECNFLQLKKMIVTECDELEYLVHTPEDRVPDSPFLELESLHLSMLSNLREIWNGLSASLLYRWFFNLREIKIRFCNKLKYVFPVSIGRGLIRLKSIEILDCSEMEGIFYRNKVDDNTNGIYLVEELYLYSLPKFVGLLVQRDTTTDEIQVDHSSASFEIVTNNNEASTSASNDDLPNFSTNESALRLNEGCSYNDVLNFPAGQSQQSITRQLLSNELNGEEMLSDQEMQCAFSPEVMNERLIKLRKLEIAFCDALEVIFLFDKNYTSNVRILNTLEELELHGLQNLKHVWFQTPQRVMAFRMLQLLTLSECQNSYLLTTTIARQLVQLRKVQMSRCEKMEEIIAEDDDEQVEAIVDDTIFPKLKVLELLQMPKLKIFYRASYAIDLPSLEYLKLNECDRMECFTYGSFDTPKLGKVQIDGRSYPITGDLNATLMRRQSEMVSLQGTEGITEEIRG